jgi:hypothetical protein
LLPKGHCCYQIDRGPILSLASYPRNRAVLHILVPSSKRCHSLYKIDCDAPDKTPYHLLIADHERSSTYQHVRLWFRVVQSNFTIQRRRILPSATSSAPMSSPPVDTHGGLNTTRLGTVRPTRASTSQSFSSS